MTKPATIDKYEALVTEDCERVLVSLLRGLGPWKNSVYLVGGLTPRYLVPDRPPKVPPHAGTGDVDVVVELEMLAETDAYKTLEQNFHKMGFERGINEKGEKVNWRWQTKDRTASGARIILELLADDPNIKGGQIQPLPTDGNISAVNIPHASIVFDLHTAKEITAELIGDKGVATETIRHADITSFTCLKAFAYENRLEGKDSHDLVYCIEHGPGSVETAAAAIKAAAAGKHGAVIAQALGIIKLRFLDDEHAEGYRKDGPVSIARFEIGELDDDDTREARRVRQRDVSALLQRLVSAVQVMLQFLANTIEQLDLATEHIGKSNPNNARFGLMLVDNALELTLHQIAKDAEHEAKSWLYRDTPYPKAGLLSAALGRNFDAKLKFARETRFLPADAADSLAICHQFRNELYHVGLQHQPVLPRPRRIPPPDRRRNPLILPTAGVRIQSQHAAPAARPNLLSRPAPLHQRARGVSICMLHPRPRLAVQCHRLRRYAFRPCRENHRGSRHRHRDDRDRGTAPNDTRSSGARALAWHVAFTDEGRAFAKARGGRMSVFDLVCAIKEA